MTKKARPMVGIVCDGFDIALECLSGRTGGTVALKSGSEQIAFINIQTYTELWSFVSLLRIGHEIVWKDERVELRAPAE